MPLFKRQTLKNKPSTSRAQSQIRPHLEESALQRNRISSLLALCQLSGHHDLSSFAAASLSVSSGSSVFGAGTVAPSTSETDFTPCKSTTKYNSSSLSGNLTLATGKRARSSPSWKITSAGRPEASPLPPSKGRSCHSTPIRLPSFRSLTGRQVFSGSFDSFPSSKKIAPPPM